MRCLVIPLIMLFLVLVKMSAWQEPAAAQTAQVKARTAIAVWDTGRPAAAALAPAAIAGENDWSRIPLGKPADSFQGDAILSNGRIAVVLRKLDRAVEVYSLKPSGAVARLRLQLLSATEAADRLEQIALVERNRSSARLEVTFRTAEGAKIVSRFRLKRGEVAVQVEPGDGAIGLRVECPGRFVVLPEFFANDVTIDAADLPLERVALPNDNIVLHLTGQGEAIGMCFFEKRKQDAQVTLGGTGRERRITGSEISFEGQKIWVAVMEAPRIWHTHELMSSDSGKVIPLDWTMPYPAQWRVDFTRLNGLTDSWKMPLPDTRDHERFVGRPVQAVAAKSYLAPFVNIAYWRPDRNAEKNIERVSYFYPCWSDRDGQGFLRPLEHKARRFQGPVVVYPIRRVQTTPLEAFTVEDVMRQTLGAGACDHILDLEGQKRVYKGRPACPTTNKFRAIYKEKQQKEKRAEIEKGLDDLLIFVTLMRRRINHYQEFARKTRQYLAEQKKAHAHLADFFDEADKLVQEIPARVAARETKIKTPEEVARLNADFRENVLDYVDAEALKRCEQYSQAVVELSGNQEELVAECRWVAKILRQWAGKQTILDPRVAPIAQEIRVRTEEAMRHPAFWEQGVR